MFILLQRVSGRWTTRCLLMEAQLLLQHWRWVTSSMRDSSKITLKRYIQLKGCLTASLFCVFSNEQILSFQVSEVAWKAVPDFSLCNFRDVLSSRQYIERDIVIPAHPRYTRIYGVTNSIAFQALPIVLLMSIANKLKSSSCHFALYLT